MEGERERWGDKSERKVKMGSEKKKTEKKWGKERWERGKKKRQKPDDVS